MEIIEQIGSYAGLAAVVGLAVLSALYFSQARDVRRLREWAGRGPERAGEPAAPQPQRVVAQPATAKPGVAKPVPQAPGQATQPGATPAPATAAAAASAAGAAPATVSGPAPSVAGAATPAGARAAEQEGVSQDTVVHPPPASAADGDDLDDADDAGDDGMGEEDESAAVDETDGIAPATAAATGTAAGAAGSDEADDEDEHFGDADQAGFDDEDDDEDRLDDDEGDADDEDADGAGDIEGEGDDGFDEDDGYDDDTGDRPAVAAPNLAPSRPLTAAGARRPVPPPALPPRTPPPVRGNATGPILPPYAKSRPGGVPDAGTQEPSGRRTAIMAILGGLLLLVGVGFGAMQLIGEDDEGAQPAGQASQQQGSSGGGDGAQGGSARQRGAVDPGSVTVAVLNGTTVPGLAAQIGDSIEGQGYQLGTITNSTDQQRAESVVLYAPGAEEEARDVARRLNISQREEADPDSQGLAGDATVIVVAGQDKTR